jgi:hypothetical protein
MSPRTGYVQKLMRSRLDNKWVTSRFPRSVAGCGHVLPSARMVILSGKCEIAAIEQE